MTSEGASSSSLPDHSKRLMELRLRRNEARKLNVHEVAEEERRMKLPASDEWRKRKATWEESEEKRKKELGADYERIRNLETGADKADKLEKKRQAKSNADPGSIDFNAMAARQYDRLSKNLPGSREEYQRQRKELGDDIFYASDKTLGLHQRKDPPEAIERLVADVRQQATKRLTFHRRRAFDPDADIDYINERNRKFNKKIDKFYGEYTADIKQNLERGTAI